MFHVLILAAAVTFQPAPEASAIDAQDGATTILRGELRQTRSGDFWVSIFNTSSRTLTLTPELRTKARGLVGRRVVAVSEFQAGNSWRTVSLEAVAGQPKPAPEAAAPETTAPLTVQALQPVAPAATSASGSVPPPPSPLVPIEERK